jgi:CheY-like chemotaxis protein
LQLLLEKRGLEVVCAASCGAALAALKDKHFDLLISDIDLPDGNGCDLLLFAGPRRPAVAIAVSGVSDQTLVKSCREAGFDELFTKPASFQRVLDTALQRLASIEASG